MLIEKSHNKPKTEGNEYEITDSTYNVPGQGILPKGTKLIECNDGYYAVMIDGLNTHYRIGSKIVNEIKDKK